MDGEEAKLTNILAINTFGNDKINLSSSSRYQENNSQLNSLSLSFSLSLSLSLSIYIYIYIYIYISICPFVCLYVVCLSVCQSIYLFFSGPQQGVLSSIYKSNYLTVLGDHKKEGCHHLFRV